MPIPLPPAPVPGIDPIIAPDDGMYCRDLGDEVARFQQSDIYPNELNIDTFTGAIDDEDLSDTVRRNLRFAAGFEMN